jgi:hypothetical protein
LQGLWQGTIGRLPVRACFDDKDYGSQGAYYYIKHLRAIPLEQVERGGSVWAEEDSRNAKGPRWILRTVGRRVLAGTWRHGSTSVPFRLTRLPGPETGESACGSMSFNQPRLKRPPIAMSRARIDGAGYTRLAFRPGSQFPQVEVATFALDRPGPAAQRINRLLREPLRETGLRSEWFECMSASLAATARDGDYHVAIEPTLVTGRWLAVRHSQDGSCGGASPFNSTVSRTFDLQTGTEIDLHGWLNSRAVARERSSEKLAVLRPAFRQFILAGATPQDAECRAIVRTTDYWDIGLRRTGLVFTPSMPRVAQACGEQILLTFSQLSPYLSPQGSAGMAALR